MSDTTRADVLNYGGGVQTVAMCVLVAQGKLPRPERILIADTSWEAATTWDYLDEHVRPMLAGIGLSVEVAPHSLATVDLYDKNGVTLMPVFTPTGKLQSFCSNEWKLRVVRRYLRSVGYGPECPIRNWIGYTTDEAHRLRVSDSQWANNHYPLCFDVPMRRADCRRLIRDFGLPVPHKSACYMCPHRTNEEWRVIRDYAPEQWQQAVAIDAEIRSNDQRGGVYLHRSLVPLAEANIDSLDSDQYELDCAGGCWT